MSAHSLTAHTERHASLLPAGACGADDRGGFAECRSCPSDAHCAPSSSIDEYTALDAAPPSLTPAGQQHTARGIRAAPWLLRQRQPLSSESLVFRYARRGARRPRPTCTICRQSVYACCLQTRPAPRAHGEARICKPSSTACTRKIRTLPPMSRYRPRLSVCRCAVLDGAKAGTIPRPIARTSNTT